MPGLGPASARVLVRARSNRFLTTQQVQRLHCLEHHSHRAASSLVRGPFRSSPFRFFFETAPLRRRRYRCGQARALQLSVSFLETAPLKLRHHRSGGGAGAGLSVGCFGTAPLKRDPGRVERFTSGRPRQLVSELPFPCLQEFLRRVNGTLSALVGGYAVSVASSAGAGRSGPTGLKTAALEGPMPIGAVSHAGRRRVGPILSPYRDLVNATRWR